MTVSPPADSANAELIQLLGDDNAEVRMLALHWLSEGYATEAGIAPAVFAVWDQRGVGEAFAEFPMLSHFPIPGERVEECCQRATAMAKGKALTDIETRCAGKLIEHVSKLPAAVLQPHVELLQATVAQSKVYFRVDMSAVQHRVGLLDSTADYLAGQLDESIERLTQDPEDAVAVHHGLHALEALRRQHPTYMNLPGVFAQTPPDSGPQAVSFQLSLQSLMLLAEPGLEAVLGKHLQDQRESVFVSIVDALVRAGSPAAADVLLAAYLPAAEGNRQWIARGLQRLRVKGLGDRLAELRQATEDPRSWLMLLVAEIKQAETGNCTRIADDVARVGIHSYALVNALLVFNQVQEEDESTEVVRMAFLHYLARIEKLLQEEVKAKQSKLHHSERRSWEKARNEALKRYRKGPL